MTAKISPAAEGLEDWKTGSSISPTPPRAAPVTEVTPKTTASSSSGSELKYWNSAAPTEPRSPA